jgi:hypothetical protein
LAIRILLACRAPVPPYSQLITAMKETAGLSRPAALASVWNARYQVSTAIHQHDGRRSVDNNRNHAWSWWYLLLLLQFVPALWVPFYNSVEPTFAGMPFFYWFQLAFVFVSAAVTAVVYWATE